MAAAIGCKILDSKSSSIMHRASSRCVPTVAPTSPARACVRYVATHAKSRKGRAPPAGGYDLVLSSGFLAFAQHAGFLEAVVQSGLEINGVMGTSAGALTGSLFCAGYSPREIAEEYSKHPPIKYLRPSTRPWEGGVLSFDGVIEKLYELLPPTFEELEREFAVGIVSKTGEYLLVDSGPLPEAIAASAAVPLIFQPVTVPGLPRALNPCKDGGCYDRVGLRGWRDRRRAQLALAKQKRPPPPALVHVIARSSQFSGMDNVAETGETDLTTVYSAKAGVNLFNLGEFEEAFDAAYGRAMPEIEKVAGMSRAPKPGAKWSWLWGN